MVASWGAGSPFCLGPGFESGGGAVLGWQMRMTILGDAWTRERSSQQKRDVIGLQRNDRMGAGEGKGALSLGIRAGREGGVKAG